MQSRTEGMPCVGLYVLAGHSEHAPEPCVSLYVPAAHGMHTHPSCPVYPALHLHAAASLLPSAQLACSGHPKQDPAVTAATVVENRFAGHLVHSPGPTLCLCVPAGHGEQCRPPYPGLHSQALTAVLPAPDCMLSGHAIQSISNSVPAEAAYVFAGHSTHAADPEPCLYLPGRQASHGPPSGPEYPDLQRQSCHARQNSRQSTAVLLDAIVSLFHGQLQASNDWQAQRIVFGAHQY